MSAKLSRTVGLWLLASYRIAGTTHLGGSCRFHPSCSEYAVEAWSRHAPFDAFKLIARRIWRCRPGGPCGLDPVPEPRGEYAVS